MTCMYFISAHRLNGMKLKRHGNKTKFGRGKKFEKHAEFVGEMNLALYN